MTTVEDGIIKPVKALQELSVIKADKLNAMHLEPPKFVVDKLFPQGLGIIVGATKSRKSWLALDLCLSVATGTPFLGFRTNQADALYLALEDGYARLQDRMRKVLNGRSVPPGLGLVTHAGTLEHGLIEQLTKYVEENSKTKLIIIDTFQWIRDGGKRGESAYATDYRDCTKLKTFADKYEICVLLVHHMRKMRDASDIFSNISGTTGIAGAVDAMYALSKDSREDVNTKFCVTGRDVEMQEYVIQFSDKTFRWGMLGDSGDVERMREVERYNNSPIILTIKKLLEQSRQGWSGTATEIINASRMFKTPIYDDSRKVGRSIAGYQEMLYQQDNILYEPVKNGSGAKKHKFQYGYNPFLNE